MYVELASDRKRAPDFAAARKPDEPHPHALSPATAVPTAQGDSARNGDPAAVAGTQTMVAAASLVESFLAGRKSTTRSAYRQALDDFRNFVAVADAGCVETIGAGVRISRETLERSVQWIGIADQPCFATRCQNDASL